MTDEKPGFMAVGQPTSETDDVATDSTKHERSKIDFPYLPLEAAKEVATALYNRAGFGTCDQDELAAEMGQTISGAFRSKTSAAKTFGLVEKDGRSAWLLSELGKRIVNEETQAAALVEAFLHVPLYEAIFEKYRGNNLPPSKALEREMEALGVASKQTDRARQAFERSAEFAGFHQSGKERLVRPRLEVRAVADPDAEAKRKAEEERRRREDSGSESGRGVGFRSDLDPIIRGLIDRLPPTGSEWPTSERKLWLGILENSFQLVYKERAEPRDASIDRNSIDER